MKVELGKLSEINKPYENNPRQNDAAVDAVAASMREFGFRQPTAVDEQEGILAGHTRFKAALKLGLEKVPVHVARGLTPEQVRAYHIADNKAADFDAAESDLSPIGFSQDELARLFSEESRHGPPIPRGRFPASHQGAAVS